jgi:hypothetical protein
MCLLRRHHVIRNNVLAARPISDAVFFVEVAQARYNGVTDLTRDSVEYGTAIVERPYSEATRELRQAIKRITV